MKSPPSPSLLDRHLHFCLALALWLGLASVLVAAAPATQELKQKSQARGIENIFAQAEENNTTSEYMLYVVLPLTGLLGVLTLLRRSFLN